MAHMDILEELESIGVIGDVVGDIDLTPSFPVGEEPSPEVEAVEHEVVESGDSQVFDFSGLCAEATGQLDQLIDCAKELRKTFAVLAEATGRRKGDG